ncbi:MAG: hypothetical protein AMXMBFR84_07800 [Candidatus Hydrogenedentota bacterium]
MAKSKAFEYGTLLRVRKRQEDLKAQRLAEVHREIQSNVVQRNQIEVEQIHTLETIAEKSKKQIDPRQVKAYYQYERYLARLSVEKDAEIARLKGIEDQRRQELVEAYKKRRMLERLKERRDAAYQLESSKVEQKRIDETGSNRASRARTLKT